MPSDITQILNAIERGNQNAAENLLPLVYEELRKLATARLAKEANSPSIQATELVHFCQHVLAIRRVGKHRVGGHCSKN